MKGLSDLHGFVRKGQSGLKTYTVKSGDNLWNISRQQGITLSELRNLNPHIKGDLIRPGDVLSMTPQYRDEIVDVRAERAREAGLDSLGAIRGFRHQGNYVLVDKANNTLTVYDKNNTQLFQTRDISTGKSGNDYNTITYVDSRGKIRNNAGNNSTPAGITYITGKGKYHGFTSFTRGRLGNNGKVEDIASSFHWGPTVDKKASNGCVRINGNALSRLDKYIDQGTPVYTLSEKEGSGFKLRNGKLNFTADNPYGVTEGPKKYWDDYNIRIDRSYSPLTIYYNGNNNDATYNGNVLSYTNSISANKQALQKRFNLSSDEYNRLAELAVGIAEQESKYGTSRRYKAKSYMPDWMISMIRGKNSARSRGMSQIKIKGDNQEMRNIYSQLKINPNTIDKPETSAVATMARLAYMYNTEVKGRNFMGAQNARIDPYDALLYKYMGRNAELTNRTATPSQNNYINNVKNYAKNFEFLEERKVRV